MLLGEQEQMRQIRVPDLVRYADRHRALKIFSLERHRERYVILMIYNIVINYIVNPGQVFEVHQRGEWFYPQRKNLENQSSKNLYSRVPLKPYCNSDYICQFPIKPSCPSVP